MYDDAKNVVVRMAINASKSVRYAKIQTLKLRLKLAGVIVIFRAKGSRARTENRSL